ncbi:MAG: sialidase, partial [Pseudomonadota bacterium]
DASLKTWTQIETNTKSSIMGAVKLADGTIVLAGLAGTMLMSKDGGKTFAALTSGTTKPLAAPVSSGPNSLLVVGESGTRSVLLAAAPAKK